MDSNSIMNIKHPVVLLAALLFLAGRASSQSYINNVKKYCSDIDYSTWQYTEEERTTLRASSKSLISISFSGIYNFIQGGQITDLITGTIIYLVIIGILAILTLGCFVLYFLYCCCFEQYASSTIPKIKLFCILACVFFLLFIVCVVLLVVFVARLDANYYPSNCAISKMPNDILEGVKFSDGEEFMGLRKIKQTLVFMNSEITNMKSGYSDFDNIVKQNPKSAASMAQSALITFSTAFSKETVTDGYGVDSSPITVVSYNSTDKAVVETEFNKMYEVSSSLYDAADQGKNFANDSETAAHLTVIAAAISTIGLMISPLETNLDNASEYMTSGMKYFSIGYYIALVLALMILVLSALMIFILYCQFAKERCFIMAFPLKACMSVVMVLNLGLIIISLGVMALSAGVSSFCDFNTSLLSSDSPSSYISSSGVNYTTTENQLYSSCLSNSDVSITTLIQADAKMDNVVQLIDGFSQFRRFSPKIGSDTNSATIQALVKVWEKYQTGLFFDFDNIAPVLKELNTQIKCNKVEFRLNAYNCTSIKSGHTCQTISSQPNYKAPDCSDNTVIADTGFTNLLAYYNDENKMLGDQITNLNGSDDSNPNSKYKVAMQILAALKTNYSKIEAKMSQTLQIADQYGGGFKEGTDCSALRTTLENVEAALCFKFNKEMFFFFVFLLGVIICTLIIDAFICITFRCIPQADTGGSQFHQEDTETSAIIRKDKEA